MVAKTILLLNMTVKVFNKVDNMRAILIALLMTIASQAGAECGNLCDGRWWDTATTEDVQAELDGGADVMARTNMDTSRQTISSFGDAPSLICCWYTLSLPPMCASL